MMNKLKEEFIELLDKDKEFRYTVAGYLGLSEILKRLDRLEEGQKRLWENQNKLWEEVRLLREDQKKLWEEVGLLREGQNKLWEEVKSLREGQNKLWEEVRSLREGQNKLWEEVKSLREGQNKLWEGQNKLWEEVRNLRIAQNRLATTLNRLTISVEEEGLDVVRHRLKNELGLDIKLGRVFINDKEINIYGATKDICVIGEATVRLGTGLVEELEEKIELARRMRPELIRPKMIKVIYTDYSIPSALELARKYGIWVLNWKEDLVERRIMES